MPAGRLTLAEAIRNRASSDNPIVGIIDEAVVLTPFVNAIPSRTVTGEKYSAEVRVERPTVGFTQYNKGNAAQKTRTELKEFQTYPLSSLIEADLRLLNKADGGIAGYFARESAAHLQSALLTLETQAFVGTSNDSLGYPGLKSQLATSVATCLDAGGSTANTASSVYFVTVGLGGVEFVFGNGEYFSFGDIIPKWLTDANGDTFEGRAAQMNGRAGFSVGSLKHVGRIYNVTADSGKGVTDNLIAAGLAKFGTGYGPRYNPGFIVMNERSVEQLRVSRSNISSVTGAKTATGVEVSAPRPTEAHGIPIIVTDVIPSTDAIGS